MIFNCISFGMRRRVAAGHSGDVSPQAKAYRNTDNRRSNVITNLDFACIRTESYRYVS